MTNLIFIEEGKRGSGEKEIKKSFQTGYKNENSR
jgi:hypothetical protein